MARSAAQKRRPNSEELSRWFQLAREQDLAALQHLLQFYRPLLMKLAQHRLTGAVRAKISPSDIVQATLWKATQEFEAQEFADRSKFFAWLASILKNTAIDERRRFQESQKRDISRERPLYNPETQIGLRRLSATLSGSMKHSSRGFADVEEILRAIERLPPHYQLVIRLRYYEQFTFEGIGLKLQRSEDAARVLHNRALQKLRSQLAIDD